MLSDPTPAKSVIPYDFNEAEIIAELQAYIDSTYSQHYSGGIQTTKYIVSNAATPDFLVGNILKYAARYGKKEGYNRKDVMKILHYGILLLYFHDVKFSQKE